MAMTFNPQTGQWEEMQFNSVTDTYEEPTGPAMPAVPALEPLPPAPKQQISPIVAEYLQSKQRAPASAPVPKMQQMPAMPAPAAAGPSSMDEYNQALMDRSQMQSGMAGAQFASAIGDALAGKDSSGTRAAFQNMRAQAQDSTIGELGRKKAFSKEAEKNDPNSQKSIAFRKLVEATMPNIAKAYGPKWNMVTEEDGRNILNFGSMRENIEARKQTAEILKGTKAAEKTDKLRTTMNEIEDRRQNINANLEQLKSMVDDKGTFESFGSHNQDMDRLIEQTATDMAKLMDPSSVARPAEVEAVKKTLIKPGFANTNATAKDILNNFQSEVDRRASSAYKIRGLEAPTNRPAAVSAGAASTPASKVVNGKKYIKVPGGWKAE